MAAGTKEYRTFVKGLFTEATALTFPEDASVDEDNFILNTDGSRQRRLGMDYESLSVLIDSGLSETNIKNATLRSYKWLSVADDADLAIGVIQLQQRLWFVDLYKDTLSANLLNSGSYLSVSGAGNDPIEFTEVNGLLVGVNKNIDPFYLTYDKATDTITKTDISIEVRDIWGIDDGIVTDNRPTTLSDVHKYNLLNQGWLQSNINSTFTAQSSYPSNADRQALGKDASDNFSSSILYKQFFGNSPSPKGKNIMDAFARSVDRNSFGSLTSTYDEDLGKPSSIISYSQRIFYSGILSRIQGSQTFAPNFTGSIFFTKIIDNPTELGYCYQEADPTSEHISDIIDSDGGYIRIPEASNILKLETTETSIIAFAENGIWEIYGDVGGFTATSYQISKITNEGITSADSVVNAEGTILYWSEGGIYTLTVDRVSGRLVAANSTEATIQTFYNSIPSVGKAFALGQYDPASRKVSWLYNDTEGYDGIEFRQKYNRELTLDIVLTSYSPYTFSSNTTLPAYVAGYMQTPDFLTASRTQNVTVNGVNVQVNGEDVVVTDEVRSRGDTSTKYLSIKPSAAGSYSFTFSELIDDGFFDWKADDGTGKSFTSFLETGVELFGESLRFKQVPYIVFHFLRTETGFELNGDGELVAKNPSSCLVQSRWDFANTSASGKFGKTFQAYRLRRNYIPTGTSDTFDYGHSVITTKNKLRGRGRALSIYISSEDGKDLNILGWGLNVLIGDVV